MSRSNKENKNIHLSDNRLAFASGSKRLTAKSYGSTPLFAAARSFLANVGSSLYQVYRGLEFHPSEGKLARFTFGQTPLMQQNLSY